VKNEAIKSRSPRLLTLKASLNLLDMIL